MFVLLNRVLVFAFCFVLGWTTATIVQISLASIPVTVETIEPSVTPLEFHGCWLGKNGGFVNISKQTVSLGDRVYPVVPASIEAIDKDILLATNHSSNRTAGEFDHLVAVRVDQNTDLRLSSFETEYDYLKGNSLGNQLTLRRVACTFAEDMVSFPRQDSPEPFRGEWIGLDGNPIFFNDGILRFRRSNLRYTIIDVRTDSEGEKFTLRVIGHLNGYESRDRILTVRISDEGELRWIRFESMDRFMRDHSTGIGRFWRPTK